MCAYVWCEVRYTVYDACTTLRLQIMNTVQKSTAGTKTQNKRKCPMLFLSSLSLSHSLSRKKRTKTHSSNNNNNITKLFSLARTKMLATFANRMVYLSHHHYLFFYNCEISKSFHVVELLLLSFHRYSTKTDADLSKYRSSSDCKNYVCVILTMCVAISNELVQTMIRLV